MATPTEANWPDSLAHRTLVESSAIPRYMCSSVKLADNAEDIIYLLRGLSSVPVLHCRDAFGIILSFRRLYCPFCHDLGRCIAKEATKCICDSPFIVVYSGDTRPSNYLAMVGKGCDILVHESTFPDALADDARKKRHSTVGEAYGMAQRMAVEGLLILTHFSQRYKYGGNVLHSMVRNNEEYDSNYRHSGLILQAHDHFELRHIQLLSAEAAVHGKAGSIHMVPRQVRHSILVDEFICPR